MAGHSARRLPEVTFLQDARGARPENAVGIGGFWYEPEVWNLPLSPAARVLYVALCSYLAHGEINRQDLRAALKDHADAQIAAALAELSNHGLITPLPAPKERQASYQVRSVQRPGG